MIRLEIFTRVGDGASRMDSDLWDLFRFMKDSRTVGKGAWSVILIPVTYLSFYSALFLSKDHLCTNVITLLLHNAKFFCIHFKMEKKVAFLIDVKSKLHPCLVFSVAMPMSLRTAAAITCS